MNKVRSPHGILLPNTTSNTARVNTANVIGFSQGANQRIAAKKRHQNAIRNKVPLLEIPKSRGTISPIKMTANTNSMRQGTSNDERQSQYGFDQYEEGNPMMESVEVDLVKQMKPKGFAVDVNNGNLHSAKIFDHPQAVHQQQSQNNHVMNSINSTDSSFQGNKWTYQEEIYLILNWI